MATIRSPLWRCWVAANAVAEVFGLGGTLALAGLIFSRLTGSTALIVLAGFALAVASGALEATIVGLAQWWALRPSLPSLRARDWWLATLVGALIAYVLGYLPSTLMSLNQDPAAPVTEPPQVVVLLLAAGLGLVAGAVLSAFQWRVLRRYSPRAGRWVPANMLAWTAGMPLIFAGIDIAARPRPLFESLGIIALTLLAAGLVVGAIHGAFLVGILRTAGSQRPSQPSLEEPVSG